MAELSNYKVNLTHQAFFSGGIESMYAKFGLNYPERTCHRYVCMYYLATYILLIKKRRKRIIKR